jgi:hypothetical protein
MQNQENQNAEDAAPQSTRLLQELMVLRAQAGLQQEELQTLRTENDRLQKELSNAHQQLIENEEASTKAFGLLGHELELARAMAAHIKKDAADQALKHKAEMQKTVDSFTQQIAQLKNNVAH